GDAQRSYRDAQRRDGRTRPEPRRRPVGQPIAHSHSRHDLNRTTMCWQRSSIRSSLRACRTETRRGPEVGALRALSLVFFAADYGLGAELNLLPALLNESDSCPRMNTTAAITARAMRATRRM